MEFKDFSLSVKDTKIREFAAGLAQGRLQATRCSGCGTLYYPPRHDCPKCFTDELSWVELEGGGRLISYTTIYVPPEHFAPDSSKQAPFARLSYHPAPVGIVKLETGLRVMGWIVGVKPQDLRVGMQLKPEPQVLKDGRATIALVPPE
ncbi:MAG: Zn-ribbon domain-containing OB-fold protein [Candidatus Bipolaricaulia bacterium]